MTETINFSSTSSGIYGYSRWKRWLGCSSRAAEDEKRDLEQGDKPWPLFPEEGEPVATTVGSLTGELIQRWYKQEPVAPSATFFWDGQNISESHPLTVAQSKFLAEEYAKHHTVDDQGELIGCEIRIEIPELLFGFPISGAIDMAFRNPATGRVRLKDLKTHGRNQNIFEQHTLEHQVFLYQIGYHLNYGEQPEGHDILAIVKNKEPKFLPFPFEQVDDYRMRWLRNMAETIQLKRANPRPEPGLGTCMQHNTPCRFFVDGRCALI